MRQASVLLGLFASVLLPGCGSDDPAPRAPVAEETPADQVLRIGRTWSSTRHDKGLLSPPSPINVFEIGEDSRLALEPKRAHETLVIEETVKLRSGVLLVCRTTLENDLGIRWGRREGEPAVELTRKALSTPRLCDRPGHPEPLIQRPASSVRFVLRSDNLIAVDPATDGRVYLPVD